MTLHKSALIVLVMFLWAVCFPLIVAGFAYAPHLTFAALRAFLAGSALVVLGMILGRPWPRGGRVWLAIFGIGLGATSLGFLGMFMASEFISPGLATVLANAQPLMAAALAAAVLGERLGVSKILILMTLITSFNDFNHFLRATYPRCVTVNFLISFDILV